MWLIICIYRNQQQRQRVKSFRTRYCHDSYQIRVTQVVIWGHRGLQWNEWGLCVLSKELSCSIGPVDGFGGRPCPSIWRRFFRGSASSFRRPHRIKMKQLQACTYGGLVFYVATSLQWWLTAFTQREYYYFALERRKKRDERTQR
jgi:hypothetical protein